MPKLIKLLITNITFKNQVFEPILNAKYEFCVFRDCTIIKHIPCTMNEDVNHFHNCKNVL